jgi:hypothetical protein
MHEVARSNPPRLAVVQRKPKRISITLSHSVWQQLLDRSDEEGRSVSNLTAFIIERGLAEFVPQPLINSSWRTSPQR